MALSNVVLREVPTGDEAENRAKIEEWLRLNPRVRAALEAAAAEVAANPPKFDALLPAFRGVDASAVGLVVSYAPMRYSQ